MRPVTGACIRSRARWTPISKGAPGGARFPTFAQQLGTRICCLPEAGDLAVLAAKRRHVRLRVAGNAVAEDGQGVCPSSPIGRDSDTLGGLQAQAS